MPKGQKTTKKYITPENPYYGKDCMTEVNNIKSEYTKELYNDTKKYSEWVFRLRLAYKKCKSKNINITECEKDIEDLSDILSQLNGLNLGPSKSFGVKKGGSKQTGGAVDPLLKKLNVWISKHQDGISDCAQWFLEKIYVATATLIDEVTFTTQSNTFQFIITVISLLRKDIELPYEDKIKTHIQNELFKNIDKVSDLQNELFKNIDKVSDFQNISLRDLAYYILVGINAFQYLKPIVSAAAVVGSEIWGITVVSSPNFVNFLLNLSQSKTLTALIVLNTSFSNLSEEAQKSLIAIANKIDTKIGELVPDIHESQLKDLSYHLKKTFNTPRIAHALALAEIQNKIHEGKTIQYDLDGLIIKQTEMENLKAQLDEIQTKLDKSTLNELKPEKIPGGKRSTKKRGQKKTVRPTKKSGIKSRRNKKH